MTPTAGGRPPRVLIVDDNCDVADSLALLLELWGCEARTAYGGQEAVEVSASFRPDCVMSDVRMPGMDGYRLAEHLRQDERLKGVLLIAISAHADQARATASGFDRLLTKPADPRVLQGLVRRLREMGNETEQRAQAQREVLTEAVGLMKEVREDVKEIKGALREVREEVKDLKQEIRDIKEDRD